MFLVVLLLRLNLTAAPMAHYVLFCNAVVFYCRFPLTFYTELYGTSNTFILTLVKVMTTLSAVWSFDALFFITPSMCITNSLENIHLPFVEFCAILYPFLLLVLTYKVVQLHIRPIVTLWRPFQRVFYRTWEPSASMIQAFSSLFFLSYAKVNFLIFQTLPCASIITKKGVIKGKVVYIVICFSKKHISDCIFSICSTIFLSPTNPPACDIPNFTVWKNSGNIRPRWRIAIKTYVETFQGCFRDSTDGTRDYRAVSGYLLFLPGFFFIITRTILHGSHSDDTLPEYLTAILLIALVILCSMVQPYKQRIANVSAVAVLSILAAGFTLTTGLHHQNESDSMRVSIIILTFIPHCVLGVYILWKMKKIFTACYLRCRNDESWWLFGHGNNAELIEQ